MKLRGLLGLVRGVGVLEVIVVMGCVEDYLDLGNIGK